MARKQAAANLYHKPLQTREPRDRKALGDYRGSTQPHGLIDEFCDSPGTDVSALG